MTLETGCLIFSIINVVFCSVLVYSCMDALRVLDRVIELTPAPDPEVAGHINQMLVGLVWTILASEIVAVIFAVCLCIGVIKKNPSYILAYLRYGIVTEVLYALVMVAFISFMWGRPVPDAYMIYPAIYLGILLIYLLPLMLVYKTYMLIAERRVFSEAKTRHKKL